MWHGFSDHRAVGITCQKNPKSGQFPWQQWPCCLWTVTVLASKYSIATPISFPQSMEPRHIIEDVSLCWKTASKGTLIFLIFSLIPLKRSLFYLRKEVLPRTPASFIHKTALEILVVQCCHRAKQGIKLLVYGQQVEVWSSGSPCNSDFIILMANLWKDLSL